MARAYLGLGSNLGDRQALLRAAIEALDWGDARVVERSSMYETEPVGGPDQPWFLNMVIGVETSLSPHALWDRCAAVEVALGRARGPREQRWGPRTIDIDVLLYGDAIVSDEDLIIPHPRMHERAFVLIPLVELAPDIAVPGRGSARALLDGLAPEQVVRPHAAK